MTKNILLTGIKPSGTPHIGNYVGMFRPAIESINNNSEDLSLLFIADYHALNTQKNPKEMKAQTLAIAATYLAFGLDVNKTILYRQSDISEIFELNTILAPFTPKGLMNRAHAYKAAVDKNYIDNNEVKNLLEKKNISQDEIQALLKNISEIQRHVDDIGINMGLYNYPILMSADILVMGANKIPVGKDQIQHIEIARDIAGSFNACYGKDVLVKPHTISQENAPVFIGTDGRKMSKSYGNVIGIFDDEKVIKKAIMGIITDSKLPDEPKNPDEIVIFDFYKQFASIEDVVAMREGFLRGGLGYGDAKKMLLETILTYFRPYREKYEYYISHPEEVEAILADGAAKARRIAKNNLDKVKKTVGVL